jgi:type IV secretion system protein VirB6
MGFFAQFFSWLNIQLAAFVSSKVELVAAEIQPAIVTCAAIYVMVWGWMHLQGMVEEPLMTGVKRVLVLIVILGVSLHLWSYNTLVVDTFFHAPDQLAASVVGAPDTISMVDRVWDNGNRMAEQLLRKGSVLNSNFAYYLAGFAVYAVVGLTCVYTAFLLALSKVAIAIIITLGPLFIGFLLFEPTKRFFEGWIAQLSNYALTTVLALMVAAFMMDIVTAYADNAVRLGSGITIAESARVCIACALVFLVMRQIPSIAAGLASGIALSSFHAVSGLVSWGLGATKRTGYEFTRGAIDGWRGEPWSRWDSFRRGAGNAVGSGLSAVRDRVREPRRGGTMVPREEVMPPPSSFRN